MNSYKIMVEGHENAGGSYPEECLAVVWEDDPSAALKKFAATVRGANWIEPWGRWALGAIRELSAVQVDLGVEEQVAKHGERYRSLIYDALVWLECKEPNWGVGHLRRDAFIADLVERYK